MWQGCGGPTLGPILGDNVPNRMLPRIGHQTPGEDAVITAPPSANDGAADALCAVSYLEFFQGRWPRCHPARLVPRKGPRAVLLEALPGIRAAPSCQVFQGSQHSRRLPRRLSRPCCRPSVSRRQGLPRRACERYSSSGTMSTQIILEL